MGRHPKNVKRNALSTGTAKGAEPECSTDITITLFGGEKQPLQPWMRIKSKGKKETV